MRIFTAVRFTAETQQYLKSSMRVLEEYYDNARLTHIENLHMTIAFIGEANRKTVDMSIKSTLETAASVQQFEMTTEVLSGFRKKNKYTVYCGVKKSKELELLYNTMNNNLSKNGIPIKKTEYIPHITLARQATSRDRNNIFELPEHNIMVKRICVMESSRINGALKYIPLAEFRLKEQ